MNTEQTEFWNGEFGAQYTDRSVYSPQELDQLYMELYGVPRSEMNREFLSDLHINSVLEVGCNVGNQLRVLQQMGFSQLNGLELQHYAVEKSKQVTKQINIIQGSAFDVPFRDQWFDLVYTSGVLIHISPADIHRVLDEMYRTSKKYIWGFEYFQEEYVEVDYRGNSNKLWKGNFMQMLLDRFPDLEVIREKKYKYKNNENVNQMYLLKKSDQ